MDDKEDREVTLKEISYSLARTAYWAVKEYNDFRTENFDSTELFPQYLRSL